MSMKRSDLTAPEARSHTALFLAAAILLAAFALRVVAIDTVPPGLTHDEIAQLGVADKIMTGDWRIFYPDNYGVEPLYHYGLAASRSLLGLNSLAMRWPAIVANMLGLASLYVLAARMFNQRVALIALATAAGTWWSIILGRVVLREGWQLPIYALALYAVWRGVEPALQPAAKVALRPFVISGLGFGLGAFVYTVSRGLFGVIILFGLYLLIFQRRAFKRVWRGLAVTLCISLLLAGSLQLYTAAHPELEDIVPITPLQEDPGGYLTQLPGVTLRVVSHFFWLGDIDSEFNLPSRPTFNPIVTVLFGVGLLLALRRFRQPAHALVLLAWGLVLAPTIIFNAHFPFTRLSAAQPLAFTLIGIGGDGVITAVRKLRSGRAVTIGLTAAFAVLFGVTIGHTLQDMFNAWPAAAETRSVYNAELRRFSRWAQTNPGPIAQCTLWIEFPWDPQYHQSIAHAAGRYFGYPYDQSRWHDCRYALVVPREGQFIFAHSDLQPLEDFLGRGLKQPWLDNAQPIAGVPGALAVDARSALQAKQAEWAQLSAAWPPEASITSTAQLPIDFNHALELIGYQIEPQQMKPGDSVRVITYWRVTGDLPADLIAFTHLYRTPTEVMAQQDRLDVDGSSLQPGDVFMQSHEFIAVPPETPEGTYPIGVGLYRKDTGERWPIYLGDHRAADRIFLSSAQVAP